MRPDKRFLGQPKRFWAHVRLLSEHIGYTQKERREKGQKKVGNGKIKVPTQEEIVKALHDLGLASDHLFKDDKPSEMGKLLLEYFRFRADVLNDEVEKNLMNLDAAKAAYNRLKKECQPSCHQPMNKQSGEKKAPSYFTCIINMLIEKNAGDTSCNYNPGELTTFTRNRQPVRTLARRVDGAFPSTVNPVALWEIKEYYYTTTFGSRVADGVYETLVDGVELEELQEHENISALHYLMVDAYDTWWLKGKSYLCRMVDMVHMGFVDEVLFGKEVIERLPGLVKEWVRLAKLAEKGKVGGTADAPVITAASVSS